MDESITSLSDLVEPKDLYSYFPELEKDEHFKVTSPCNPIYNCIAWAMGVDNWWVDPCSRAGHWWPSPVARDGSPESLSAAFSYVGFEPCEDGLPEKGYDKVALYMDQAKNEWTHAARIISQDEYHSKIGRLFDIHHSSDVIFDGTDYGVKYAYMRRPIALRDKTAKMIARDEGDVVIT